MFTRVIVALVALAVAFAILGADGKPVQKTPVSAMTAASGAALYDNHCAGCHGTDGRGAGPAAADLNAPLPDLSKMAVRNGGIFPEVRFYRAVTGDHGMPSAHGSPDSPVWGDVFLRSDPSVDWKRVEDLDADVRGLQL